MLNLFQVGIVLLAGLEWDGWMQHHRLWSADALGVTAGALVGVRRGAGTWAGLRTAVKLRHLLKRAGGGLERA